VSTISCAFAHVILRLLRWSIDHFEGLVSMTIGQRIRKRRQELGLTQDDIAKALTVTPQHISAIELDQRAPSLEFLVRLAEYLGTTTDFILTGKETIVCDLLPVIKADKKLPLEVKNALIAIVERLYGKA